MRKTEGSGARAREGLRRTLVKNMRRSFLHGSAVPPAERGCG